MVALDTETTGLDPYTGDVLRGISLAWELNGAVQAWYIPVSHPESANAFPTELHALFSRLRELSVYWVMHHASFDCAFLAQLNAKLGVPPVSIGEVEWDTQIVAWLLDENMKKALKYQGAFWFGEDERAEQEALKPLIRKKGWAGLTAKDIWEYACQDASLTYRLCQHQKWLISEDNPWIRGCPLPETIERANRVSGFCYRLDQTGIKVDYDKLCYQRERAIADVKAMERYFKDEYACSITSPAQLGNLFFEQGEDLGRGVKVAYECNQRTPTGKPQVNKLVLEGLATRSGSKAAALVLEHRRLKKALTGYLEPIWEKVAKDGRLHPHFSSIGTVTGRFSCSGPNLQTIPRKDTLDGIRELFIAEDDFELWEYDLSQAELRIMAGWSGDERLIGALEDGRDMHTENATAIWGPGFKPIQRRVAKNVMYGFTYGIGPRKLATYLVEGEPVTEHHVAEARAILADFRKLYPKLTKLMDTMTNWAEEEQVIEHIVPGRFRRFRSPGVHVNSYTALNALVQGAIGEYMKDAGLALEHAWPGIRICLQVHDSFVCEVPIYWGENGDPSGERVGQWLNAWSKRTIGDYPFKMPMTWDSSLWSDHA